MLRFYTMRAGLFNQTGCFLQADADFSKVDGAVIECIMRYNMEFGEVFPTTLNTRAGGADTRFFEIVWPVAKERLNQECLNLAQRIFSQKAGFKNVFSCFAKFGGGGGDFKYDIQAQAVFVRQDEGRFMVNCIPITYNIEQFNMREAV